MECNTCLVRRVSRVKCSINTKTDRRQRSHYVMCIFRKCLESTGKSLQDKQDKTHFNRDATQIKVYLHPYVGKTY